MISFSCPSCDQLVFFENTECLRCGQDLGFDPDKLSLVAFAESSGMGRCANQAVAACNWLVPTGSPERLCRSCRLTRTRPADSDTRALAEFAETEAAKRRLVYQLLDLGLPIESWADRPGGLGYDLLSSNGTDVVIGHDNGIITLDLAETDDPHREQVRQDMGEPYRTMLGHLRHETGHYYWHELVESPGLVEPFRELFGDERADYGKALQRHYADGAPAGWESAHVSAYATMHPWEDWAETFAHYLHIRDTLQTAASYGMRIEVPHGDDLVADPEVEVDHEPFDSILADWLPLTYALNAVNRSMGNEDLYPFVLSPSVVRKLTWVHHQVTLKERAHNRQVTAGTTRPSSPGCSPAASDSGLPAPGGRAEGLPVPGPD